MGNRRRSSPWLDERTRSQHFLRGQQRNRTRRELTASPQTLGTNITTLPPTEVALHVALKVALSSSDQTTVVGIIEPGVDVLVKVTSCSTYDDTAVWTGDQVVVFVVLEAHHVAFGQFGCFRWDESCDHAFDGDDLALKLGN